MTAGTTGLMHCYRTCWILGHRCPLLCSAGRLPFQSQAQSPLPSLARAFRHKQRLPQWQVWHCHRNKSCVWVSNLMHVGTLLSLCTCIVMYPPRSIRKQDNTCTANKATHGFVPPRMASLAHYLFEQKGRAFAFFPCICFLAAHRHDVFVLVYLFKVDHLQWQYNGLSWPKIPG